MTRDELTQTSINIITTYQSETGAYVASPNFHEYRYSWLRDGSFIAYAMLKAGRPESAERFLRWTARTITRHEPDWAELARAVQADIPGDERAHMPTRFTLDGTLPQTEWPDFQIDGYGTWLWLLDQWCTHTGNDVPDWATPAVQVTLRYLACTWNLPNYDAWEENGDKIHPATLACVYGGMRAMENRGLVGEARQLEPKVEARDSQVGGVPTAPIIPSLEDIKNLALSRPITEGTLPKYLGSSEVDASLLWCAVPFGMVSTDDPRMVGTVKKIEWDLVDDGGVHRYRADTYYGGGRWILLTAWLGWYYLRTGRVDDAWNCAEWIQSRADSNGTLPEQVTDKVNDRTMVQPWLERWGPVAKPLLWSHGMYLVLVNELEQYTDGVGE